MTGLAGVHEAHGATFETRGDRTLVAHYGRPDRAHAAVRNGAGLIEHAYDVIRISGADRIDFVDNAISNRVREEDGHCVYALMLTPQGRIRTDMTVFTTADALLLLLPPGQGGPLAEDWREKTFIQDVDIDVVSDEFAIFGVHGPQATESVASVFSVGTPEPPNTFVRGSIGDAGVTVVRTDGPTGEDGFLVVCGAEDGKRVFDALEHRGMNAAPFGYRTWESLTLEAGTPLFETELEGRLPNDVGLENAIDYEKGCFVGQEVVSRIHNRGQPSKRLVGLRLEVSDEPDTDEQETVEPGTAVLADGTVVGELTRSTHSPTLEKPIALAFLEYDLDLDHSVAYRLAGSEISVTPTSLPFVD